MCFLEVHDLYLTFSLLPIQGLYNLISVSLTFSSQPQAVLDLIAHSLYLLCPAFTFFSKTKCSPVNSWFVWFVGLFVFGQRGSLIRFVKIFL